MTSHSIVILEPIRLTGTYPRFVSKDSWRGFASNAFVVLQLIDEWNLSIFGTFTGFVCPLPYVSDIHVHTG
jgi:hypothetical protein